MSGGKIRLSGCIDVCVSKWKEKFIFNSVLTDAMIYKSVLNTNQRSGLCVALLMTYACVHKEKKKEEKNPILWSQEADMLLNKMKWLIELNVSK